ncbi:hypothetical protein [Teredinibacter waterburyi]|uniref:hypothetical protein n=1 Tax=Teredinibacter waterburyi TaxID=1500538 RepID=UPI00165FECBB|nr:hypothetical protein [Teredinibacter waterburyi]
MKYILVVLILFSTLAFGGAVSLEFEELSSEDLGDLHRYAEQTVSMMRKNIGDDFGYNEDSIKKLSDVIDREGPTYSDQAKNVLPTVWGAFLGEAIIRKYGGKWVKYENSYGVLIEERSLWFPLEKVMKHIENGKEDSIYALYLVAGNDIRPDAAKQKP